MEIENNQKGRKKDGGERNKRRETMRVNEKRRDAIIINMMGEKYDDGMEGRL